MVLNTTTLANINLPMESHWTWSWEDWWKISTSHKLVWAGFSILLDIYQVQMKGKAKVIEMNSRLSSWNVFIDICGVYQKDDDFVVQLLSCVRLFATQWTAAHQAHLSPPSPGVCSNPCSLSQWSLSHWVIRWVNPLIISLLLSKAKEEATRFSFSLQSFPASGSFPMSQLFISGGQSIVASALASVFLMNIQGWFPLGLTCLSSLLSKGLWRVFSIAQGYCVIAS